MSFDITIGAGLEAPLPKLINLSATAVTFVSGAKNRLVTGWNAANDHSGAVVCEFTLHDGTNTYLIAKKSISQNDWAAFDIPIMLRSGSSLRCEADTANVITCYPVIVVINPVGVRNLAATQTPRVGPGNYSSPVVGPATGPGTVGG